jgi:hypothetical protein
MTFWEQFQAGSTAAGKEFNRLVERNDMAFGRQPRAQTAPERDADKPEKLGKKDLANRDAQTAHEGTAWSALLQ